MPDRPVRTPLQAEAAKQEAKYLFDRQKLLTGRMESLRALIQNPGDDGCHRVTDAQLQGWNLAFADLMDDLFKWREQVTIHVNKNQA